MNYLILKLPNFLFIMLSISFNFNKMYPPIYSVGFLGFSIANTEWFSVNLLATRGFIYLSLSLLNVSSLKSQDSCSVSSPILFLAANKTQMDL